MQLSVEQLNAVEDGVIETILTTVLHLPEMNFRSIKFTKVTSDNSCCVIILIMATNQSQ